MLKFISQRLISSIVTLVAISIFIFALIRLVPGDPATLLAGETSGPEELLRIQAEWGLNKPIPEQYIIWIGHALQGDLGQSLMTGEPVVDALSRHFGVTLQLVLLAFVIAAFISIPLGLLAAWKQATPVDYVIVSICTLFTSVPSFWVALLLILFFGIHLGWLPTLGFVPIQDSIHEWFEHIILPVSALITVEMAILTRLVRASAIEVLNLEYISFARSKGLSERTVLLKHVLVNAMAPCLTMLGLILSSLLSGTVIIETIFGIPGLGRFLIDGIYARDYPAIQGALLLIVVIYILVNFVIDILQPLFDPRIRIS
jgi:peptide/nickel transport system permease protein